MDRTLFIAVSTSSRQGSIAEFEVPYDPKLVAAWHERRLEALGRELPVIPFLAQPEMQFQRGKECRAEWFMHGDPTPRINEKGVTYGWDTFTGRAVVPLQCSYCAFSQLHCWKTAVMEMDGTKPVLIVPTPESPTDAGGESPVPLPSMSDQTPALEVES